jgi:signal transduction histidine kinase
MRETCARQIPGGTCAYLQGHKSQCRTADQVAAYEAQMAEAESRMVSDIRTAARSLRTRLASLRGMVNSIQPSKDDIHYHDLLDARSAVDQAARNLEELERLAIKWGAE